MPQAFARNLLSWPETVGLIGFIFYPFIAIRLLLKKGQEGLLGFALFCPWLLFATEFSTVRIQEPFVLYRSYLWMAGAFAALPFLCQKLNAKQAAITLSLVALLMVPLSWLRLTSFSHSLLLWDDAARLIENDDADHVGGHRIFYNRGTELVKIKHYNDAIEDLTKAIMGNGEHDISVYNNRAFAYLENHQYLLALNDINKAIELAPKRPKLYIGKAKISEALKDSDAATQAYNQACLLGLQAACQKAGQSGEPVKVLTDYLM